MFGSLKSILISFFLIMILTAILFWFGFVAQRFEIQSHSMFNFFVIA